MNSLIELSSDSFLLTTEDDVITNANIVTMETGTLTTTLNSTVSIKLPFDDATVVAVATILLFFLVFGFAANLLTILVISRSDKLNTVFNQFILSLCVSDLFSACISWLNLHRRTWGFDDWGIPNFFCAFYWGADVWTSYVTALHIVSFGILRLLSVWKPIFFSKIKAWHAKIWISVIWIIAFLCGFIPFFIFSGAKKRDRSDTSKPTSRWPECTQNEETLKQYSLYIKYAYPIFFYFPLFLITVVSIIIIVVMVRRQKRSKKSKEMQAIAQLLLIVGSFMLGYIPFTVYEFDTMIEKDATYATWKRDWLFGTVQYMCLRLSECLNPIFYNLASTKMRKETMKFLMKLKCSFCVSDETKRPDSRTTSQTNSGLVL